MRLTLAVLAVVPTIASAQIMQMPEPADLQAAYCAGIAKKAAPALDPQLNRIRAYLAPRIPYLDAAGLLTASQQAERDIDADVTQVLECAAACHKNKCQPNACRSSDAMHARIQRCKTLDFLPY